MTDTFTLSNNLDDLAQVGVMVELTPEQMEAEGLVIEDAVDFETAMAANGDVDTEAEA